MLNDLILKADTLISSIEPYTLDIVITVLVAVFTIILAIGEDVKNKYYP